MWRRSQAEGLLASASLPSYRGAGCRGFSIRIGMCHQRPHPLRWGSRDLYGASWPRAMCPRGTRGTRAPGLRGSIAHSATPNARCACHSPPPSGTAFYDNCTYVDFRATRRHRVRGLPATRCRRVAPVRQRGSRVIKEMGGTGWHAARSHREGAAPDGSAAASGPSRAVIPDAIRCCAGLCRAGPPTRLRPPSTSKGVRPTRGKQPSSVRVRIKSR